MLDTNCAPENPKFALNVAARTSICLPRAVTSFRTPWNTWFFAFAIVWHAAPHFAPVLIAGATACARQLDCICADLEESQQMLDALALNERMGPTRDIHRSEHR